MTANARKGLMKFLLLLLVLAAYFAFLSWKYDVMTGGVLSLLTWSFFVLCTPIADAGFLLDFPIRLITGMRMVHTEMIVWALAGIINTFALWQVPEYYQKSFLTTFLHKVITTPWPYGGIIVLCALGTFISIRLGDDVFDGVNGQGGKTDHVRLRWALLAGLFAVIFTVYYFVLKALGVDIGQIL